MLPVHKGLEGELLPDEAFLEHNPALERPHIRDCSLPVQVLPHDPDSFAPGETDRLDRKIPVVISDKPDRVIGMVEGAVVRAARDAMPVHHLPAECLVRLEHGCFQDGPDAGDTSLLEAIDNPRLERGFRSDDGIIGTPRDRKIDNCRDIGLLLNKDIRRERGNPGIVLRHYREQDHLFRTGERTCNRMFPPPATDHQHLHSHL